MKPKTRTAIAAAVLGTVAFALGTLEHELAAAPPPAPGEGHVPQLPRHYSHIRIAMLAYAGNPMGPFEDRLLRESVDLVIPNPAFLKHIHAVAPRTPKLIYTNTSNLYLDLLLDWLAFADARGIAREDAFYHAAKAQPFRGDSPSSKPVTWFWGLHRGGISLTNVTSMAHNRSGLVFGAVGQSVLLGYPERFREINLALSAPAGGRWTAVLEYVKAVDPGGRPREWSECRTLADTSAGLTRSGQFTFDPPPDWKPATVGDTGRLYYVRFRTRTGGTSPVAATVLGRDYVTAHGTTSGIIPAFDRTADLDHDGYLNDAEYARRAPGKHARFSYEGRLPTESYGQMRFGTNPASVGFRAWAVDYHKRLLEKQPLAAGLFMDNSAGKPPVAPGSAQEPVQTYARDCAAMLKAISHAITPRWVLANTAGGQARAEPIIRQNPAYFEEFAIRPLMHHYVYFEDLAASVTWRATLTIPAPLAVLDSHPQQGSVNDGRTQLAALAYYYLVADPDETFLMLWGGYDPAGTWQKHWLAAVAHDVGRPSGKWALFATGTDPANRSLGYRVYQRPYEKALVLYKPLSYARGSRERASLGEQTATRHDLRGSYRPLHADGTLGVPVSAIALRNGEGAILVKTAP